MRSLSIFALVGAVALVAISSGAVAENVTNESNVSDELEELEEESEYLEQVDSQVRLLGHEYRDGDFRLRLENTGERPTTVTIAEAVQFSEGTGSLSIQQERLLPGETTVVIPVTPRAGEAAVTLTTSESLSEGTGTYVSTGTADTSRIFTGPATWDYTFLAGIVVFLGTARSVAKYYRTKKEPDLGWRKP